MKNIISNLTIELNGASMYSEQECSKNPKLLEDFTINLVEFHNGVVHTKIRRTKPVIMKINVYDDMITKGMTAKDFEKSLKELAMSYGGILKSYTYPFEASEKYKEGDIVVL